MEHICMRNLRDFNVKVCLGEWIHQTGLVRIGRRMFRVCCSLARAPLGLMSFQMRGSVLQWDFTPRYSGHIHRWPAPPCLCKVMVKEKHYPTVRLDHLNSPPSVISSLCQKCKGQYLAPAQWSTAVQERTIIVFICDTEMWRVHFQRALQITL